MNLCGLGCLSESLGCVLAKCLYSSCWAMWLNCPKLISFTAYCCGLEQALVVNILLCFIINIPSLDVYRVRFQTDFLIDAKPFVSLLQGIWVSVPASWGFEFEPRLVSPQVLKGWRNYSNSILGYLHDCLLSLACQELTEELTIGHLDNGGVLANLLLDRRSAFHFEEEEVFLARQTQLFLLKMEWNVHLVCWMWLF